MIRNFYYLFPLPILLYGGCVSVRLTPSLTSVSSFILSSLSVLPRRTMTNEWSLHAPNGFYSMTIYVYVHLLCSYISSVYGKYVFYTFPFRLQSSPKLKLEITCLSLSLSLSYDYTCFYVNY